jgi:hypothetical protein
LARTAARPASCRAAVHLHDAPADALAEVLVDGPDLHLLDALVLRRQMRRRCERIIGLEIPHRPADDAHRDERILQRMELRPQRRLDPRAGLVAVP